jgi:cytoskeletal protein CcmA (bactofilin family)
MKTLKNIVLGTSLTDQSDSVVRTISILFLLLLAAVPVAAAQIEGGDRVVIAAGEVRDDDVIAGAETFILEGTVQGDLVVFGGTVTIARDAFVEGDLIAAGGHVILEGRVRDDARIAGAVLTVGQRAEVGDDLIAAGQSLETMTGSWIGGELLFGGGQGLLAGSVVQGARLAANGLDLRGRIGGNVDAAVGQPGQGPVFSPLIFFRELPTTPQVAPGLAVREGARIEGDLNYVGMQDAAIPAGAVGGKVTRQAPETPTRPSPGERVLGTLRTLGALLVVGLLLLWVAPSSVKGGAAALQVRPGSSLGWGVTSLFASFFCVLAITVAAALAAVVLGVLSLGSLTALAILAGIVAVAAFVLAFVVVAFFVSKVVVAYLGGRLILGRIKPEWAERQVTALLAGVLVLVLLGALPVLGGAIHFLAVLLGLGALWLLARDRFRSRRIAARLPQAGTEPPRAALPTAA